VEPGQRGESAREALVVAVEALGQLPGHRAEAPSLGERRDRPIEALDAAPEVGQPLHVREAAARLGGEAVEGRVQLDRVERRRVALQPARLRQPRRVEARPRQSR
jgi:hypothetical protein